MNTKLRSNILYTRSSAALEIRVIYPDNGKVFEEKPVFHSWINYKNFVHIYVDVYLYNCVANEEYTWGHELEKGSKRSINLPNEIMHEHRWVIKIKAQCLQINSHTCYFFIFSNFSVALALLSSAVHQVDPCDNFYEYTCGNWRNAHPLPSKFNRWTQDSIIDRKIRNQVKGKMRLFQVRKSIIVFINFLKNDFS